MSRPTGNNVGDARPMSRLRSALRPRRAATVVGLVLLALVGGTLAIGTLLSGPADGPPGTRAPAPMSTGATTLAEEADNTWAAPAAIDRAIAVRTSFGLPAGRDWVVAVASMPSALANVPAFGVPLTNGEVTLLTRRAQTTEAASREVQRYGRDHPDVWGGLYVDGGSVVAQFVDLTPELEVDVRASVSPSAPLFLREVRWTLADLQALQDRIRNDSWLFDNYDLLDLGVDVRRNEVQLQVSSADPATVDVIEQHYGNPAMLAVTTDRTGVTSMPTGSLLGRVVDPNGNPVPGLDVELDSSIPGSNPTGDVGAETNGAGAFFLPDIPATDYVVRLFDSVGPGGTHLEGLARREVGELRVTVEPGATNDVTIPVTLDRP